MHENNKIFGLDNIRNTCYLNSTLQCLFTYPVFRDKIKNIDHESNNISGSLQHILTDHDKTAGIKLLLKTNSNLYFARLEKIEKTSSHTAVIYHSLEWLFCL